LTCKELEEIAVMWRQAREDRLAADKVAAKLKEEELRLKGVLVDSFREQSMEGVVINGRFTGLRVGEQPVCEEHESLRTYILETQQLELLEFRLSKRALAERKEQGIVVPGVKWVDTYDLADRKI
jgi:hypothetical protein